MKARTLFVIAVVSLCVIFVTSFLNAQVPQLLNYQGKLVKADGKAEEGTFTMVFSIYSDSTGTNLLWTETHNAVPVSKGVFNRKLNVPGNIFATNGDRFLGIKVGAEAEMRPLFQLTSVPYAQRTAEADGVANNAITNSKIANNAITSSKIQDGQVGNADLAANAVTSDKIQNGTITGSDISSSTSLSISSLYAASSVSSSNGYIRVDNTSGSARAYLTVLSSGEGYVETVGPNGQDNCRLTTLSGNSNHGYVAVIDASGTTQAGIYVNSSGQGVVFGDTKNFRISNPLQSGTEIWYACPEGPEAAAYIRGTAKLINGRAVVTFPDHFSIVANSEGMTVHLTPLSGLSKGLAVVEKSNKGIIVQELNEGVNNYDFDYMVMAVRKGHENYKVVREISEAAVATANKVSDIEKSFDK